jgi:hypothetical protein
MEKKFGFGICDGKNARAATLAKYTLNHEPDPQHRIHDFFFFRDGRRRLAADHRRVREGGEESESGDQSRKIAESAPLRGGTSGRTFSSSSLRPGILPSNR